MKIREVCKNIGREYLVLIMQVKEYRLLYRINGVT